MSSDRPCCTRWENMMRYSFTILPAWKAQFGVHTATSDRTLPSSARAHAVPLQSRCTPLTAALSRAPYGIQVANRQPSCPVHGATIPMQEARPSSSHQGTSTYEPVGEATSQGDFTCKRHLLKQGKEEDLQKWRATHRHSWTGTRGDCILRGECESHQLCKQRTTTEQYHHFSDNPVPLVNTSKRTGSTCANSSFIELRSVPTPVFQGPTLLRRPASYLNTHFRNLAAVGHGTTENRKRASPEVLWVN